MSAKSRIANYLIKLSFISDYKESFKLTNHFEVIA
jgi:hypothetical protein